MPKIHHTKDLADLAADIAGKSKIVDKAAADTLNKTATFSIRESIEEITRETNLQPNYIKKHLTKTARASASNLRTVVSANARATLLTRYPLTKTKDGYKVAVNKTGGYREIKGAMLLKGLRGSAASGIALRNTDAVGYFKNALSKGKRTQAKSRKLQKIIAKARSKPNGVTVLHSRSINQLFTSVREDIQPEIKSFMHSEFLKDFNRLNK